MVGKKRMSSAEEAAELCADSNSEKEWFDGDDDESSGADPCDVDAEDFDEAPDPRYRSFILLNLQNTPLQW
jgi:hypothetical protein